MLPRELDHDHAARRGLSFEVFGLICTQAVLLGLVYFILVGNS